MEIREMTENKKQFLPLLLLGDEQEDISPAHIDRKKPGGEKPRRTSLKIKP